MNRFPKKVKSRKKRNRNKRVIQFQDLLIKLILFVDSRALIYCPHSYLHKLMTSSNSLETRSRSFKNQQNNKLMPSKLKHKNNLMLCMDCVMEKNLEKVTESNSKKLKVLQKKYKKSKSPKTRNMKKYRLMVMSSLN